MFRARLGQVIDPNTVRELAIQTRRSRAPGANALGLQPQVTITISPQSPGYGEKITIQGKATIDGIPLIDHKVSLLVDGQAIGTAIMGVNGYTFQTSVSQFGDHTIQATVQLSLLRQKNSAQVAFSIQPLVTIEIGQDASSSQGTVSINTVDQSTGNPVSVPYSYTIDNPDGTQLTSGNGTTDQSGNDQFQFTPQQMGPNQVVVTIGGIQTVQTFNVTHLGSTSPAPGGTTPQPLALQVTATPKSGYVPLNVTIGASASGGTAPYSYMYQFGDGGNGDTNWLQGVASAGHQYAKPGTYTAVVTVMDSAGLQTYQDVTITVNPQQGGNPGGTGVTNPPGSTPPQNPITGISLVASPQVGEAPLTVQFTATVQGGTSGKVQFTFDWGDGTPSLQDSLLGVQSHQYQKQGAYPVKVTAYDPVSNTSTSSVTTVTVSAPVTATLLSNGSMTAANPASPSAPSVAPATLVFTVSYEGGKAPFKFNWSFGDGTSEVQTTSPTVSHEFVNPGTFPVICTILDATGQQLNVEVQVGINPASSVAPLEKGDIVLTWYYQGIPAYESGNIFGSAVVINKRKDITADILVQVLVFDETQNGKLVQTVNQKTTIPPGGEVYQSVAYTVATPGDGYSVMIKAFDSSGNDVGDVDLTQAVAT